MNAVIVHVKYWEELDRFRFRDKSELTMKCAKFGFHPPILILADSRSAPSGVRFEATHPIQPANRLFISAHST
jgi:hypothetical protein